jgi:hypothetical protein
MPEDDFFSIDGNATSVALMLPKGASPVAVYRKFQTQDSLSHVVAARFGLLLPLNPFESPNSPYISLSMTKKSKNVLYL